VKEIEPNALNSKQKIILEDRNKSLFLGSDPLISPQNFLDTKTTIQSLWELIFINCLFYRKKNN